MPEAHDSVAYVVYGGAFDPPHAGHRDCARLALEFFKRACLWVVPSRQPAGAYDEHKTVTASYEQRLNMCRLAFAGLPRLVVSSVERDLPRPNYTITTLEKLRADGHTPLVLLIGQDQLASFHAWREPRRILEIASLAVVDRPGPGGSVFDSRGSIEALLSTLGFQAARDGRRWVIAETCTAIYQLGASAWPAASRDLRAAYAAGAALPQAWLTPELDSFIREHALYGT